MNSACKHSIPSFITGLSTQGKELAIDKNHKARKEIETEIILHINKRLFERGLITEEMYAKTKGNIA